MSRTLRVKCQYNVPTASTADWTYEVWISRDEIVDFLLYAASLEASVATRSNMSRECNQYRMFIAWKETWLTIDEGVKDGHGAVGDTGIRVDLFEDYIAKISGETQTRLVTHDAI